MTDTAVIILHYQNVQDTLACLKSIFNSENKENKFIVLVINNSEDDRLKNSLEKISDKVIIIQNNVNAGFARGNNIGIRKAITLGCNNFILLNNDTLVRTDTVKKLVEYARDSLNAGIFSPKIYFAPGYEYHKNRYKIQERGKVIWYAGGIIDWKNIYPSHVGVDQVDKGQFDTITDTDFATGCCMLIKKDIINKVGYFDEKYFLYFEDVDFSQRVKKYGFRVMYNPLTSIWHKNAASSGKPGSSLHNYYQTRNRLYFGFKYAGVQIKALLIKESLKMLVQSGRRNAVLDFYTGKMGGRFHEN